MGIFDRPRPERFPQSQTTVDIDTRPGPDLRVALTQGGVYVYDFVEGVLEGPDLQGVGRTERVTVLNLRLEEAGIKDYVRELDDLESQLGKQGLGFTPQRTAPSLALAGAPIIQEGQYVSVLSQPIRNRHDDRVVLGVGRSKGVLELGFDWIVDWDPDFRVVCSLR